MARYIEDRDGVSWVPNPVNPLENFADKWQQHPQRETKFRQWLQQARTDLDTTLLKGDLREMTEGLKPLFGDRIIHESASKAFPTRYGSASAAVMAAPHIGISNPSKPWGT